MLAIRLLLVVCLSVAIGNGMSQMLDNQVRYIKLLGSQEENNLLHFQLTVVRTTTLARFDFPTKKKTFSTGCLVKPNAIYVL